MKHFVLSLALTFACLISYAGNDSNEGLWEIGTFHSPKGFGVSFGRFSEKGYDTSISAIFDMAGILMGKTSMGGGRFIVSQNYSLREWTNARHDCSKTFYAGPAFTGGYVRDNDFHMGLMAGIGAVLGIRFTFPNKLGISLEMETDAAAHLSYDKNGGHLQLGIYDNGFRFALYPQVKIMYAL